MIAQQKPASDAKILYQQRREEKLVKSQDEDNKERLGKKFTASKRQLNFVRRNAHSQVPWRVIGKGESVGDMPAVSHANTKYCDAMFAVQRTRFSCITSMKIPKTIYWKISKLCVIPAIINITTLVKHTKENTVVAQR